MGWPAFGSRYLRGWRPFSLLRCPFRARLNAAQRCFKLGKPVENETALVGVEKSATRTT